MLKYYEFKSSIQICGQRQKDLNAAFTQSVLDDVICPRLGHLEKKSVNKGTFYAA